MPVSTVEIIEIMGPCVQGRCEPYKCRGENDAIYYVKGRQTNRASLWHEWICAHLAKAFRLSIPVFEIVNISEELLKEAPAAWRELGAGLAFGSRHHPHAIWLEPNVIAQIPEKTQCDVLVFDWWIRNMDRSLGNPNLLFDSTRKELVVIDHNLAFDSDFSKDQFLEGHLFATKWDIIQSDLVMQAEYAERLSKAMADLDGIWNNGPDEWCWCNPEQDVPANVDAERIKEILHRCDDANKLWNAV